MCHFHCLQRSTSPLDALPYTTQETAGHTCECTRTTPHPLTFIMASGIELSEGLPAWWAEFKKGAGKHTAVRNKYAIFKISNEDALFQRGGPETTIIVETEGQTSAGQTEEEAHEEFVSHFKPNVSRWGVFDHHYTNDDGLAREKFIFYVWTPENVEGEGARGHQRRKMVYTTSTSAFKGIFDLETVQAHDAEEVSLTTVREDYKKFFSK